MHRASELEDLKSWSGSEPLSLSTFKKVIRQAWKRKFGDICQSCSSRMFFDAKCKTNERYATIDHIDARALGGKDSLENIQVICKKCNNIKSADEYRKNLG